MHTRHPATGWSNFPPPPWSNFGPPLTSGHTTASAGQDVEILQGHVRPDHVHLLLGVPPHLSPSRVMQAVKGVASSGNVTDETIAEYIRLQGEDPAADERFEVSD